MMKFFIKFADTLSTSMGKAFSWCIVILMGGTVYEVVMAYVFNKIRVSYSNHDESLHKIS